MNRLPSWLLLVALVCGCADRPRLVPASGKVLHKGRPLTAGSVIFVPLPGNAWAGDSPSSLLQTDGAFTMKTFPHGPGVAPGAYKVTLDPALAARIGLQSLSRADQTPWRVEIPGSGRTDLVLEAK